MYLQGKENGTRKRGKGMKFKVTFFKKSSTDKRMKVLTVDELLKLQELKNYKICKVVMF